jgi:hypothetical protein
MSIKKSWIVTPAVAGVLGLAGLAAAAFTTNSEPWASTTIASPTHPSAAAVVVGNLWPGDCNAVSMTIQNPNPHAVKITGISNTGFRNSTDTAPSENGNGTRLQDFISQANVSDALTGQKIGAGHTRTFTIPKAVCLSPDADDARQGTTIQAGYAVAYQVVPGNDVGTGTPPAGGWNRVHNTSDGG